MGYLRYHSRSHRLTRRRLWPAPVTPPGVPGQLPQAITVSSDGEQAARWTDFARAFAPAARAVAVADRPRLVLLARKTCAAALAGSDTRMSDLWWCLPPAQAKPHQLPLSSTALGPPPVALLPMWDQGLVDRWDAFPAYLHACAVSGPAELRSRVWRAQLRTLMPTIDEERARMGHWLRSEIRNLPDEAVLEPGGLVKVLEDHPVLKMWRGGHRKRLIYWLRDARNTLAHMKTLAPDEIDRGQRLIREDRRHG